MLLATQPKMSLPNDDPLDTELRPGSNTDLVKPAKFQANKLPRHLSLPPLNNMGPFMGNNYLDSPLFLPVITVEPSPTTGIQHLIPPLFQSTASRSTYPESLSTSPRPSDSNPPSGLPSPISKPGKQSAANDDGYQWRKYGEKIVKGSAFPRSYYKCSHQGCPAKKIIEKTENGLANAEYKGQHNHPAPHTRKGFSTKPKHTIEPACMPSYNIGVPSPVDLKDNEGHASDAEEHDPPSDDEEDSDDDHELPDVPLKAAGNDSAAAQLAIAQLRKAKEEEARRRTFSELAGSNPIMQQKPREFPGLVIPTQDPLQALAEAEREYAGQYLQGYNDVEPVAKRFKMGNNENLMDEEHMGKRSVTHTVMDSSQLDDGYKWRKYGQKTVKSNPNPRSYYKCTYPGCTCRKHVERCADDSRKLMITYEGEHNHAPPTAQYMNRSSIRRLSNTGNVVFRPQNTLGSAGGDAEEMDASLKLALQALPSVSLPQPAQPAQQAAPAPTTEGLSSFGAALLPQLPPQLCTAGRAPASLQEAAKPALKRNKHLPALKMPEDLANEAEAKDSAADALVGLSTSAAMPAWPAANPSHKGTALDALAPALDTPTGGLSWLDGCLTTPKPASPGKQAVQLPIPPLRDAPPAPLQAP